MTSSRPLTPSSATTGFIQPRPYIPPQFVASQTSSRLLDPSLLPDPVLPRILRLYLPYHSVDSSEASWATEEITSDLARFAELVLSKKVLDWTRDAEVNIPVLRAGDMWGGVNEVDPLRLSEGWRRLQRLGIREGVVGLGHACAVDERNTGARAGGSRVEAVSDRQINYRVWQFGKIFLWTGSAAMVTCPSGMTDGAAVLLGRHVADGDEVAGEVFRHVRQRLISRDPRYAWTSGQWMTERAGGSDVRGTETVAVRLSVEEAGTGKDAVGMPLGPWSVSGFKWFSSATDADCSVLLAQTENGLSAFYAPMRVEGGKFNGVRIVRLKEKMGTKSLPTAELELKGMRAWLVGTEGHGTKEISHILNVTRLHTGMAQIGYWTRALAVSRAFARSRKVSGGMTLEQNRQHVRWMARETVKYRAAVHLVAIGSAMLGFVERGAEVVQNTYAGSCGLLPENKQEAEMLLRVLTPIIKAQMSLASVEGLRACMESLGGVGYLENNDDIVMNVARLYRDANVGPIWEGTTSVIAEDLVRVLRGKNGPFAMKSLGGWIGRVLATKDLCVAESCSSVIQQAWESFEHLVMSQEVQELHWRGREVLSRLEAIVCAFLLLVDAAVDRNPIAVAVARRWIDARFDRRFDQDHDWKTQSDMDFKIYMGVGSSRSSRL